MYLSKECPQLSLPRVLARFLLPTVCRVLLFLGILTPFSANSTSNSPFSLPASVSPVSPVSLPSFVFLPCSQTDFSSRNPSVNPSNFALHDPLLRIKEENPATSQAEIDLRSLPEGTKKLLNAWIGKKSAEWTSTSASIVQFTANLLESIPLMGVSSVNRSKVVPCFSFSCKTRFVFPAFLSTLLVSPSLTMQQLDELDSSSQSLLFVLFVFIESRRIAAICFASSSSSSSSLGIGSAVSISPFDSSRKSSVSRVGLSENTPQLEFVASGEFWKWQAEAVRARREAEKLCGKERKLWAEFLKRFGVILRGLIGLQFLDRRRFQLQRSSKAREFDSTRASTARKRHERAIA